AMPQSGLPASQTANGAEYGSGGSGEDAAQAAKPAAASWPLSVVFAEEPRGGSRPYVAEVRRVVNGAWGDVRVEVRSAGPAGPVGTRRLHRRGDLPGQDANAESDGGSGRAPPSHVCLETGGGGSVTQPPTMC